MKLSSDLARTQPLARQLKYLHFTFGEQVRNRTTDAPARLTARETQIAWLAGDGLSNPEIAAQLFMSPRTVEYHLHKVFTKLGISSRNRLHDALADHGNEGPGQIS